MKKIINEIIDNRYPICDADVWVYACFGDVEDRLIEVNDKIIIADVVEREILRWRANERFSKVAIEYEKYKEQGKILVISHEIHIPEEHRSILESMLTEFGFKNYFENVPPEKDKGEYVSAIYADYFGISFFRTNDHLFAEEGQGRRDFPDLHIKNWYDTLRELIPDHTTFIQVNKKIRDEQQRCEHYKSQHQAKVNSKQQTSLDLVAQLKRKWS